MLLFRFVCSFTTPVRVIFLYHIWCINTPSYLILSYIYIYIYIYKYNNNINSNLYAKSYLSSNDFLVI